MRTHLKRAAIRSGMGAREWFVTLVLLTLPLTGCDNFLDVENPANLLEENLHDTQLETALSNSGEANLSIGYSRAVVLGEMLGDHVFNISNQDFGVRINNGDRRNANSAADGMYNNLSSALSVADDMVNRLQNLVSNPGSHLGIARNYFWGGAARVVLISYFEELTYDGGPPVPPSQALRDAIERFEMAAQVAAAAGDRNLEAGSYGAIARAYRGLYYEELHYGAGADPGLFQQAETYGMRALNTHADFNVELRHGSPGPVNQLYNTLNIDIRHRPTPQYYQRPDPVSGVPDDVRIKLGPQIDVGLRNEPVHLQSKWTGFSDPVSVSRAAEAELVVAEARLIAGDLAGAVLWINRVRSKASLPDFQSTVAADVRTQLIYERDTEFWLEGRRWEDHRYYEIIPPKWPGSQVAIGVHQRFRVSVTEMANNPHYAGR